MNRIAYLLLLFALFITGCDSNEVSKESSKVVMPAKMPSDFDFKIQFGVMKNNEINTFENTVTKDLIADGTVKVNLTFTTEEMTKIYEKMKEVNITEKKDLIPKTDCMQEPFSEDEWMITINGESINHYVSEQYCDTTDDAKQLIELRNYIFTLVKSKEEYKNLPEANGWYE
ncbi:hypothetical protein [Lysinibacillus telephonicus]|uniref:Uncharacterized protein n=1 Tax=Lysinibacillus telephonicus TaxID=1714840 RepID=A0A3S0QX07_9BACI|nr:hypothetical protein [Lysinibacillus telephonicus]RTQ94511.1 hypothetical protein EKG35_05710 [Lysinibacillus telephonicus]